MNLDDAEPAPILTVSASWLYALFRANRRFLVASLVAGLALSMAIALSQPTRYTSTFSFTPQSSQDQAPSGISALAGQFGISVGSMGSSAPPQFYADLLETRSLLSVIVRDSVTDLSARLPIPAFFDVKAESPAVVTEMTVRALRRAITTSVATHTTGVVEVKTTTRSAQASLEIARKLVDGLNRFNVETRRSRASEERRFIEGRLRESRASLRVAEDALQQWLQNNRQYGGSAELALQKDRLQREVVLRQQVMNVLVQQFEEARIREVRDTPVITIIEEPALPALPDPKGRVLTIVAVSLLTVLASMTYVLARALWRHSFRPDTSMAASGA